jgi:DNA-directed RNA polymerase subunit D
MKIEVLEKQDNIVKFILEGTDNAFLNSLRRAATTEIPTMAIEDVEFTKNSSALYDEIVAHRLGLIPLKTDLKTYNIPSECKCKGKGCNSCQLKLTLNVKGPAIVYSGDLKSKDPKVVPAYTEIPIVKLNENQEIKLTAIAVLGIGKEHSKWSTGHLAYQYYPDIKINAAKLKDAKKCLEACPRDVYELDGDKLKVKNLLNCNLCKACQDAAEEGVNIDVVKDKFIVTFESWGQLSPKEILMNAADKLSDGYKALQKALK